MTSFFTLCQTLISCFALSPEAPGVRFPLLESGCCQILKRQAVKCLLMQYKASVKEYQNQLSMSLANSNYFLPMFHQGLYLLPKLYKSFLLYILIESQLAETSAYTAKCSCSASYWTHELLSVIINQLFANLAWKGEGCILTGNMG